MDILWGLQLDCRWFCTNIHHNRPLTILGIALLIPGSCAKEGSHERPHTRSGCYNVMTMYLSAPDKILNLYILICIVLFLSEACQICPGPHCLLILFKLRIFQPIEANITPVEFNPLIISLEYQCMVPWQMALSRLLFICSFGTACMAFSVWIYCMF